MIEVSRPAVQRLGGAVLLQGPAVIDALHLVTVGIRETSRRDGITPSPRLQSLLHTLEEASAEIRGQHSGGHADVRQTGDSQAWNPTERIGTKEAAQMLMITERQVRRLALSIGCTRGPRGVYTFDRGAVAAYATHRTTGQELAS